MRAKNYSDNLPLNLLKLTPKNCQCYLDVGCAAGVLGKTLKECNEKIEVYGIEMNRYYAKKALENLDGVICGNVEEIDLSIINKQFDCIIYSDILEHLKDPWSVLETHKEFISPGGVIVVSIPNVQFIGVILSLIFGNWNYKESGILDRTHLRFFTKKTIKALLCGAGYRIESIKPNYSNHKVVELILKICSMFGFLQNWFARQFLVIAKTR